ncbi:MAG: glycosyltransferase [bacterium]
MSRKKIKVCIVRFFYFPKEAHVRRDVKTLLEQGYKVDVICLRDKDEKISETWNGVSIYRIPLQHKRGGILRYAFEYCTFFFCTSVLLTLLFLKKRYNIIEVDTMPDFLVFSTLIPKIFGARVILYLFENMPYLFAQKIKSFLHKPFVGFLKIIERTAIQYAHKVLITCVREEPFLKDATIILNVPDETMFIPEDIASCNKTKATCTPYRENDELSIITHSTLTWIYGIQYIIYALSLLVTKYPKIKCEILGVGEFLPSLKTLVSKYGLTNHIIFKGFVPYEKLAATLLRADVGVVSVISEYLLPNKLFEYVALGLPVICADHKTIRHFFSDEELIFYNPLDHQHLAERIEWAMFHRDSIQKMAERTLMKYQKYYCWEKTKKIYLGCYESLSK